MSDVFTAPDVPAQLAQFSPADTAIAVLAEEYLALRVDGIKDTEGYLTVHRARMDVKGKRVQIEKVRKELKADALTYGRKVDGEAKRLTALLEPIERHLLKEEKAVDDERARIRNTARLAEEAEAKAKAEAEAAEAKRIADAEAARIKAEQDAENERLQVERKKLEAERWALQEAREVEEEKQREAQEKLDAQREAHRQKMEAEVKAVQAEKQRLANIEAERVRAIEMEKAKAEAAERAQKETVARMAREAEEVAAQVKAEEDARVRAEALKPDREKLLFVADEVAAIGVPTVSEAALEERIQVVTLLGDAEQAIRAIVEKME